MGLLEIGLARVPEPAQALDVVMADRAVIRLRRYGNLDAPVRLVLSHGNGLAIDGYYPFWARLCNRHELVVFDFRNHGRNPPHGPQGHDWPTFLKDLEQVWQAMQEWLGRKVTVGVFHSLSAITALEHALRGRRWDALVVYDPPIFPRAGHPLQSAQRANMAELAARSRARRERYRNPEELARLLAGRAEFRRWGRQAYQLMARATLRPSDNGAGWMLACPRELEAQIFESNVDPTLWPRLASISVPLRIVGSDPQCKESHPAASICRAVCDELGIDYTMIPDTTHFLQVERPSECVAALESFLEKHRLLG